MTGSRRQIRAESASTEVRCQEQKRRQSGPLSRILFPARWRGAATIYLGGQLPAGSSALPAAWCATRAASRLVGAIHSGPRQRQAPPSIWACWRWGLPCRDRRRSRGALLPHLFTLTTGRVPSPECSGFETLPFGGLFSVALSLASLPVAVGHHRALTSSDFPPGLERFRLRPSGRLARFVAGL